MLLIHQTYGEETASVIKQKLISGKVKPWEITNKKGDFKLCFKCKVCKDKSFQRFYIRFAQVRRTLKKNKK